MPIHHKIYLQVARRPLVPEPELVLFNIYSCTMDLRSGVTFTYNEEKETMAEFINTEFNWIISLNVS